MIAQALCRRGTSIIGYLNDFIQSDKLTDESRGSEGYLMEAQTQRLIQYLCNVTYYHIHQIVAYIKTTFGVEYTVSGLNKWLHHHHFSYKKPKGVLHILRQRSLMFPSY